MRRRARNRKTNRENSSRKHFNVSQISEAISMELANYSEEVTEAVKCVIEEVTDDLVSRTKKDAPKRYGAYKRAISSKVLFENEHRLSKVWYVKKPNYRLAHLLNNGHKTRNNKFMPGDDHITKNEEIARKDLEKGIEGAIKNGL